MGTPALKPYMHGYFISLKLYDAARVIANPFVYAEHKEKLVRDKMEKMAETRIRTKKDVGVKVNRALAEKILRDEERARKREEKKTKRRLEKKGEDGADAMDVDEEEEDEAPKETSNILTDPRFAMVFEDPKFAVDETSREFALLNPSTVAQRSNGKGKTAVEDEEDESDKVSSDGLGDSDSESGSEDGDSDSSEDGGESYLSVLFLARILSLMTCRAEQVRSSCPTWPEKYPRRRGLCTEKAGKSDCQRQLRSHARSNRFE